MALDNFAAIYSQLHSSLETYLCARRYLEVHHVRITIPEGIDTLDFSISQGKRGFVQRWLHTDLAVHPKNCAPMDTGDERNRMAASYACSSKNCAAVLRAAAEQIERITGAEEVRAHIMLPMEGQWVVN